VTGNRHSSCVHIAGVCLGVLLLGGVAAVLLAIIRPANEETVIAIRNRSPGWRITVSYQPNATLAQVDFRMDTLAQ
jgi:hypothetical protein